jgi:hypothetical protein
MTTHGWRFPLILVDRLRPRGTVVLCTWILCAACASTADHTYPRSLVAQPRFGSGALTAQSESPAMQAVTGHWEGVTSADCIGDTTANPGRCHAMQNITLTMLQQGDEITGYYTCAFGNQVCRNLNESGVIRRGVMTGRRLLMRVMLGDGSMCFFTGMPMGGVMEGRYSCLQGGGIVERGAFRTERSY